MNRLLQKYKDDVISALTQKFSYKNIMQVPKLDKIVINIACGDAVGNSKALKAVFFCLHFRTKTCYNLAKKIFGSVEIAKGE